MVFIAIITGVQYLSRIQALGGKIITRWTGMSVKRVVSIPKNHPNITTIVGLTGAALIGGIIFNDNIDDAFKDAKEFITEDIVCIIGTVGLILAGAVIGNKISDGKNMEEKALHTFIGAGMGAVASTFMFKGEM